MVDRLDRRLLAVSAAFVIVQGAVLTLSPVVRERTWDTSPRFSHWLGILVWALTFLVLQRLLESRFPSRDPYLLPLCALLTGWGILTIWRLDAAFGMRQAAWLAVSAAAVVWLAGRWGDLGVLRRYKYVLLGGGLLLTALTIVLGTSPTGVGPRLWLGCCGLYLQPAEPLKLLFLVYLAAYLADQIQLPERAFPLLVPTLLVVATALLLLVVQRDLGSASILILLYSTMLYVATERRRVLVGALFALILASITGFFFVDIIQARLESWLNPWMDASGRSYQIVQSLLSIANGGIVGRGLGLGSPGLVPVAHSDFIYSAIAEEAGLVGSIGLLTVYGLLLTRGSRAALGSRDRFRRLLGAGLTAYIGVQSMLIIGGNLRLLPLTGVTLPFVSYGGSSLLTSAVALALLSTISAIRRPRPPYRSLPARPLLAIAALLGTGIAAAAFAQLWWAVLRGPDLLTRTDNARRAIADRYVRRGALLSRNNRPINRTAGSVGDLERVYEVPNLSVVSGYTHPGFGQAGLEASLDPYLRGLQGNPTGLVVWHQLLYGTPPEGLDVRLALDLRLQGRADALLGDHVGAIVLLDARSGEIIAMASHPTFDANALETQGTDLLRDDGRPLINRATQGLYPVNVGVLPIVEAAMIEDPRIDPADIYQSAGFLDPPAVRMPVASAPAVSDGRQLLLSPLQLATAAAALSNDGQRPSARMALALRTSANNWVVLPALDDVHPFLSSEAAAVAALRHRVPETATWGWESTVTRSGQAAITWSLTGTLPDWPGSPVTAVVLLESDDLRAARSIGSSLLSAAIAP